jgi:uncharacterized protein
MPVLRCLRADALALLLIAFLGLDSAGPADPTPPVAAVPAPPASALAREAKKTEARRSFVGLSPEVNRGAVAAAIEAIASGQSTRARALLAPLGDDDPNKLFLMAVLAAQDHEPPAKAMGFYERAAQRKHPLAMADLGAFYLFGVEVPKDAMKALRLLEDSYDAGYPPAGLMLASVGYMQGLAGFRDLGKAREILERPEFTNDAEAQYLLGDIYSQEHASAQGIAPPADEAKAKDAYLRSARLGNKNGMMVIALFLLNGWGVPHPDIAEGFRWMHEAADQGNHSQALMALGEYYSKGSFGVTLDRAKAAEYFRRAAAQNNPKAQVALAKLIGGGGGAPRDLGHLGAPAARAAPAQPAAAGTTPNVADEARKAIARRSFVRLSPEANRPAIKEAIDAIEAQRWAQAREKLAPLGDDDPNKPFLLAILAVQADEQIDKIVSLYEKAAALKQPLAMNNLAVLYLQGKQVPKDGLKAFQLYKDAFESGYEQAGFALAIVGYIQGLAGFKDYEKAKVILERPSFAENAEAQSSLGEVYSQLNQTATGPERGGYAVKAKEAYRRSAELGFKDGMLLHAMFLLNGWGATNPDVPEGLKWMHKAADQENFAPAQTALGHYLSKGQFGVAVDPAAAVAYYKRAAVQNSAQAQFALAQLLYEGRGVQKDLGQAYVNCALAQGAGVADASALLQQISGAMSPGELSQARKFAADVMTKPKANP